MLMPFRKSIAKLLVSKLPPWDFRKGYLDRRYTQYPIMPFTLSTDVWLATVIGAHGRGRSLWLLLGIRVGPIPVWPHPAGPPSVFAWTCVS